MKKLAYLASYWLDHTLHKGVCLDSISKMNNKIGAWPHSDVKMTRKCSLRNSDVIFGQYFQNLNLAFT